jgi:hypothetical protein
MLVHVGLLYCAQYYKTTRTEPLPASMATSGLRRFCVHDTLQSLLLKLHLLESCICWRASCVFTSAVCCTCRATLSRGSMASMQSCRLSMAQPLGYECSCTVTALHSMTPANCCAASCRLQVNLSFQPCSPGLQNAAVLQQITPETRLHCDRCGWQVKLHGSALVVFCCLAGSFHTDKANVCCPAFSSAGQ